MENIHRLAYHCSKVEAESRYVMKSFLSIPLITYFIRGRDPTSRYLEGLQRPELVCLSLVRKVHLDLLSSYFSSTMRTWKVYWLLSHKKGRYTISPSSGFRLSTMVKNPCKSYGSKKVFPLAICSLTEVVNLQIMPKEHSVVAVQDLWIGYMALI